MLVILGEEGTGKTSILNRWQHWLKKNSPETQHEAMDLSRDAPPGVDSQRKVEAIIRRLIERLEIGGILNVNEVAALVERQDIMDSLPRLSDLLVVKNRRVSIAVPTIEVQQELLMLARCCRQNILVFAESTNFGFENLVETAQNGALARHVACLRVGGIDVADGLSFVSARLSVHSAGTPTIDDDVVRSFMEKRIQARGGATIRELQRTLEGVFEAADLSRRDRVEMRDIQDYFIGLATP